MFEVLQQYLRHYWKAEIIHVEKALLVELPLLYTSIFDFAQGVTMSHLRCVYAIDTNKMKLTPKALKIHIGFLAKHFELPVVYVKQTSGPHEVERLVAQDVPFIIPNKSIHLPFVMTAFKHNPKEITLSRDYICLCAQLIVMGVLLKILPKTPTIKNVVHELSFSRASVISAFKELEYFGFGLKQRVNNSKEVNFEFSSEGKALWEYALPFLRSPVQKTLGVEDLGECFKHTLSGEDALAQRSMLVEQDPSLYAIPGSEFKSDRFNVIPLALASEKVQLWRYDPHLFDERHIDTLSLILSLRDVQDERVQIACTELLENFSW